MAFVNERLSAEQREEFWSRGITYSLNGFDYRHLEPYCWTCDNERNMYLIYVGVTCRDTPDERVFFFLCDYGSFVITLRLKKERLNDAVIRLKWDKFNILSQYDKSCDISVLKQDVSEALKAFELFGKPEFKLRDQFDQVDFVFEL